MVPGSLTRALAVLPQQQDFVAKTDPEAESRLRHQLQTNDRCTETVPLVRTADILLSPDGLLQRKYRLTTTALQQLCSLLSPGLSQALGSLSGLRRTDQDANDELFDLALAVRIFNDVASFRFGRLAGVSLVIDQRLRQVEGVAGRRYALFSNWSLYTGFAAYAKRQRQLPQTFNEAFLIGRRLVLRYRGQEPAFRLSHKEQSEPFLTGLQFENTEVGECSLRGTHLLIRQWTDVKAMAPVRDANRVRHVKGPSFERRLQHLFRTVPAEIGEQDRYQNQVLSLRQRPLGFGESQEATERRVEQLVRKLVARRLSRDLATRVLRRTLTYGSYRSGRAPAVPYPLQTYALRNAYDLFNALGFEAKREPLEDRLRAEQLAYQLLVGSFTP